MYRLRRQRLIGRIWRKITRILRIVKNIFLIIVIVLFGLYAIVAGWLYWEFSRLPKVRQETVLVLDIEGMIMDRPSADPASERLVGAFGKTRRQIVNNIRKAAKDPRIIAILVKFGGYGMDQTTAFDIQEELLKFKESGKKVFAFMKSAGLRTYLLASAADKIYMPVSGTTYLVGLRAEIPFMRKMFDTIGVTPEFIAIGKYKTAPQIFTMDHISDEYREVMNNLLDELYDNYTAQIAAARNISVDEVKAWIDDGIYSAKDAQKAGMVDELVYESQLEKTLQRELGLIEDTKDEKDADDENKEKNTSEDDKEAEDEPELRKISNGQYARVKVKAPKLHTEGEKIAVIYAQGSIVPGRSNPPSSGTPTIGADSMTELLTILADDDDIKGIILRVDSGGGGARSSDIIHNAVYEAKQKKPVVVSMAGAATSGGYMISASADSIVAYPMTLTGSIGIFGGKFSMEGLFDFIGINVEIIQRGKNAGMFSGTKPWTESERERLRENIQQGYDNSIAIVAKGRDMSIEAIDKIAQGRVWMGKRALELGLVDKLGGLDTAIEVMKEKLDIPEDEDVQIVEYPKAENPFSQLLRQIRQTSAKTQFPAEILRLRDQLTEIAQLQDETLFAWFPCRIIVE